MLKIKKENNIWRKFMKNTKMILTLAIVAFFISIPLSSKAVEVPFTRDCSTLKKLSHKWIMCQTTGKYSDETTVTKKEKVKKVKKKKKDQVCLKN